MSDFSFVTDQMQLRKAAMKRPPDSAHEGTRFVSQALIFSSTGSLLTLLKNRESSGHAWDLPGGGVERRENFLEAIDCELREELGIIPSGYYTPFSFSHEAGVDGKQDYAVMTFLAVMRDEISPHVDMVEHVGFAWQKWGSIREPRTMRFNHFLNQPAVNYLDIEDIAKFSNRHKNNALFLAPPDPTQLLQTRLPS